MSRLVLAGAPDWAAPWLRDRLPGWSVEPVASGRELLDRLAGDPSALAVIDEDVGSPGLMATLEERSRLPGRRAPVFVALRDGRDTVLVRRLLRELGVERVIAHPLDPETVSRFLTPLAEGPESPLWARFRPLQRERLQALEAVAREALEGPPSEDRLAEARRLAHTLAGSLGTLGLLEGTRLAREIEELLAGDWSSERGLP